MVIMAITIIRRFWISCWMMLISDVSSPSVIVRTCPVHCTRYTVHYTVAANYTATQRTQFTAMYWNDSSAFHKLHVTDSASILPLPLPILHFSEYFANFFCLHRYGQILHWTKSQDFHIIFTYLHSFWKTPFEVTILVDVLIPFLCRRKRDKNAAFHLSSRLAECSIWSLKPSLNSNTMPPCSY